MAADSPAHELVGLLAGALATEQVGTGTAAAALAELRALLASDAVASAVLTLFASEPHSSDLQRRLSAAIQMHCSAAAIERLCEPLRGFSQVRARISADEDALIQGSGHKILAPDGPVDVATSAGKRGRIIDSPITIVGAGAARPQPGVARPAAPATRSRPALPSTLSADGEHFSYGHALLIGVGAYQDDWLSVSTTAADARELGGLLRDPKVAGYPAAQVRVLTDAQATRAGILDALEAFAQRLKLAERPTAVLFFAGHGKQHESGYYLLPHDYDRENVAGSAISAALFHEQIASIRQHAQKLIVLLNCCHSGGIGDRVLDDTQPAEAGDTPPAEFYGPLVTGGGQVVISAARPWQKAGAGSPHAPAQTLFGARLLDALRGQAPGDGAGIGVFELFSYLSKHIPTDATTIDYQGKPLAQEPLLYAHQLDSNVALALRPGWQGGTLDTDLATLIEQLAQAEIELAGYARETDAPAELRERRDELLTQIEAGG